TYSNEGDDEARTTVSSPADKDHHRAGGAGMVRPDRRSGRARPEADGLSEKVPRQYAENPVVSGRSDVSFHQGEDPAVRRRSAAESAGGDGIRRRTRREGRARIPGPADRRGVQGPAGP